jgi:opacity protein-like surface antigen
MAGVGYDISDGVTLDVGYRFLDMGKSVAIPYAGAGVRTVNLREHQVRVGLRYRID